MNKLEGALRYKKSVHQQNTQQTTVLLCCKIEKAVSLNHLCPSTLPKVVYTCA
jgi:hypothetical protein